MPKDKTSKPKNIQTQPMGGSGTPVFDGIYDVEYKHTLSTEFSSSGLRIYERMRKSDPVVRASLRIIKLGLLQGEWFVESASEDSKDEEIKEFVEEALFTRMDRTFEEVLKDSLTHLDFGFYVSEKLFKLEDNLVYWKDMGYRAQTSITRFLTQDGEPGVTQQLIGDSVKQTKSKESTVSIPMEKLMVFTNDKEGDNLRGVSLLRPAYKPWFFKESVEKIDAIGFEREAVGIPVFKMPDGNANTEDVAKAEEIGKNLRANEKAYVILPSGWELDVKYPSGSSSRSAEDTVKRYNRDIFYNVLAQFLDLGSSSVGSRSLSEDHTDVFYRSLQAVGDYVASIWNTQAIKQLVSLNFPEATQFPKLKVTGIRRIDENSFSTALLRLTQAGILVPDDELEEFVRDLFKLPNKPEDMLRGEGGGEGLNNPKDPKNPKNSPKNNKDVEEDIEDDKKKKDQKFNETRGYWRELTFAEEKVNFESISRNMDRLEGGLSGELPAMLAPTVDTLIRDARAAIEIGDMARLDDLVTSFRDDVFVAVRNTLAEAFEIGKITASNELDVNAMKTSVEDINFMTAQAKAMADKITDDLRNTARLNVLDNINREVPAEQALESLEAALLDQLVRSVDLTASVATVGGINNGRGSVFEDNEEDIHGLQRSEILDNRICNFCLSMDGRIVEATDPIAKQGVFHFRCRGIWVAISKEEAELPNITGVPESLRERIGTLTEFKQIPQPKPLDNSLAEEFVNERKG